MSFSLITLSYYTNSKCIDFVLRIRFNWHVSFLNLFASSLFLLNKKKDSSVLIKIMKLREDQWITKKMDYTALIEDFTSCLLTVCHIILLNRECGRELLSIISCAGEVFRAHSWYIQDASVSGVGVKWLILPAKRSEESSEREFCSCT